MRNLGKGISKYGQPFVSMRSIFPDSTNLRLKIFEKKVQKVDPWITQYYNYLHSIYTELDIISSLEII